VASESAAPDDSDIGRVFTVSSVNYSSVFNVRATVLKSLEDLHVNKRERDRDRVPDSKAMADNVNNMRGTEVVLVL